MIVERVGVRVRPSAAVVAVVACVMSAAACGSSDESGTDSGSTAAATTTTTAASANTRAQEYIGGKPGKASGDPVSIGFVNPQGGPVISIPQATDAAQAAVKYINEELGGVHGRPLQLKTCFVVGSEEEGQACGEKFAADDSVNVVSYAVLGFGEQSLMGALRGEKPLISSAGNYKKPTNAYTLNAGPISMAGGEAQYLLDGLKARSVAMIVQGDSPPALLGGALVKKALEGRGVQVRTATIQGNAPNVAGALVSAGAKSADALLVDVTSPGLCLGVAKALPQLSMSDMPLVSLGICVDPAIAKATGDMLKGTFLYATSNTLTPDLDPDVQIYHEAMKRYAPDVPPDFLTAPQAFSVVMTVAKYLNATDSMTADEISKEAAGYRGRIFMAQPKTDCGFSPADPSLCSNYSRAYTYAGDGKWTAGQWISQSILPVGAG